MTTLKICNPSKPNANSVSGASFIWDGYHRIGFCNDDDRTKTIFIQGPLVSARTGNANEPWTRVGINKRGLDLDVFLSGEPFEFVLRKKK